MKALILICPKMKANGMALFPFILVKRQSDKNNIALINHEKIHLKQQLELLILPFYFLYLVNYLVNLLRFRQHHLAYKKIIFEQEAYANDENLEYLKTRKIFAFFRYI